MNNPDTGKVTLHIQSHGTAQDLLAAFNRILKDVDRADKEHFHRSVAPEPPHAIFATESGEFDSKTGDKP